MNIDTLINKCRGLVPSRALGILVRQLANNGGIAHRHYYLGSVGLRCYELWNLQDDEVVLVTRIETGRIHYLPELMEYRYFHRASPMVRHLLDAGHDIDRMTDDYLAGNREVLMAFRRAAKGRPVSS